MKQGLEVSGSRKRVSGMLSRGKRGLILTTRDDQFWVLETAEDVEHLLGRHVVAEGAPAGLDRLKMDWIGAAE